MEGNILAWNPKAERMYGWSEAEALKMNINNLIPENRREEELVTLKKLSQAEVLEPYRTQRLIRNNRIMEVWLTATSLVNAAGEVYAISTTERHINSKNKDSEKQA
jgi:two-component system CheB/CheR fusion protein